MQETVALQQEIWHSPGVEVMPVHALLATSKNGGQVLGAFVDGALVGMTVGLAAWRDGQQPERADDRRVLPRRPQSRG